VPRSVGCEAEQERGRDREVAGSDHSDLPLARQRVDLRVVVGGQPARPDDDSDTSLDGREDVAAHRLRVCVVDEHVGRRRIEGLGDRREARRIGP
jgi:hypothetical protein